MSIQMAHQAVLREVEKLFKRATRTARLFAALSILLMLLSPSMANANTLGTTLSIANPTAGAYTTYTFTLSSQSAVGIGCISVWFSTTPGGAVLTDMDTVWAMPSGTFFSDWTGWQNSTGYGYATFYRVSGTTTPQSGSRTLIIDNVQNSMTTGTRIYVNITTYSTGACNGGGVQIDSSLTAFILPISRDVTVGVTVDPALAFSVADEVSASCNGRTQTAGTSATGSSVVLGRPTTSTTPFKAQRLNISSNAANGFTVYARSSGQLTTGSRSIANWTGTSASPTAPWSAGSEYFGYTTSDSTLNVANGSVNRFTNGGAKFAALTGTNAEVVYGTAGVVSEQACVGYMVGVSSTTSAGSYQTTVTYLAIPQF